MKTWLYGLFGYTLDSKKEFVINDKKIVNKYLKLKQATINNPSCILTQHKLATYLRDLAKKYDIYDSEGDGFVEFNIPAGQLYVREGYKEDWNTPRYIKITK